MTTTATAEPTCPKCEGPMWNQKYGKFPWKPGTPIFKCKDRECATNGGVIWEPKGTAAAPPKTIPAKTPIPAHSNVPDKDLPPFLQNATAEDNASLAAKVGVDLTGIQKDLAIYQAQTEFVLTHIAPLYTTAGIGMSPESAAACVQTLFINSTGGRK